MAAAVATAALCCAATACVERQPAKLPGDRGDPWALGYAVQVSRSCPGWEVEPQRTLAERGVLPTGPALASAWAFNSPFQRDYYDGLNDAEVDGRSHPEFCRNVRAVAGPRWSRLARVFKPRSPDRR